MATDEHEHKNLRNRTQSLYLNFHGLGEPGEHVITDERRYWLTEDRFSEILALVVKLQKYTEPTLKITFDDGNKSDVAVALPLLLQNSLTAKFFVCAGRIGEPGYLDRDDLTMLLNAGMQLGSHGMHHVNLRHTSAEQLDDEINMAREIIGDACGIPINEIAIPFGSYDRRVLKHLNSSHWNAVFSSDGGVCNAGRWLRPRNTIAADTDVLQLYNRFLGRGRNMKTIRRNISMFFKSLR